MRSQRLSFNHIIEDPLKTNKKMSDEFSNTDNLKLDYILRHKLAGFHYVVFNFYTVSCKKMDTI